MKLLACNRIKVNEIKANENYIYKNIEPIRALENFLESVGGK